MCTSVLIGLLRRISQINPFSVESPRSFRHVKPVSMQSVYVAGLGPVKQKRFKHPSLEIALARGTEVSCKQTVQVFPRYGRLNEVPYALQISSSFGQVSLFLIFIHQPLDPSYLDTSVGHSTSVVADARVRIFPASLYEIVEFADVTATEVCCRNLKLFSIYIHQMMYKYHQRRTQMIIWKWQFFRAHILNFPDFSHLLLYKCIYLPSFSGTGRFFVYHRRQLLDYEAT